MDQQQREIRRAAAQAFSESLDLLKAGLQPTDSQPAQAAPASPSEAAATPVSGPVPGHPTPRPSAPDWDEAVADIEQFIQARQNP